MHVAWGNHLSEYSWNSKLLPKVSEFISEIFVGEIWINTFDVSLIYVPWKMWNFELSWFLEICFASLFVSRNPDIFFYSFIFWVEFFMQPFSRTENKIVSFTSLLEITVPGLFSPIIFIDIAIFHSSFFLDINIFLNLINILKIVSLWLIDSWLIQSTLIKWEIYDFMSTKYRKFMEKWTRKEWKVKRKINWRAWLRWENFFQFVFLLFDLISQVEAGNAICVDVSPGPPS